VDIFKNILQVSRLIPPRKIKEELLRLYPLARSLEWSKNKGYYEVIFYENDTEMIARFSEKASLIEYRINHKPENLSKSLPLEIITSAKAEGEIMNCITVNSDKELYYEFIVRDKELVRYLLLLDSKGSKTSLEKL
jgi:hypothetical protein